MKCPYAIGGSFAGLMMTLIMTPAATVAAATADEHASVYKSGVAVVSLGVTVTDNQQNSLRGLGKQDFAVYEDGRPQDVRYFAAEATPLDLAILLDTSASMGGTFLEVREAAMQLARALRPGDRASFTEVKRGMRDLQPLSSDTSGLPAAIRKTTPGGSTAIYDAIYIALRTLNQAASTTEVRRQALVILSDGDDTASLLGYDEVLDAARRNGVTIYAVSLRFRPVDPRTIGYDPRHVHGDRVLRQLAQQTGGQAFFSPGRNKLGEACRRIASELASQYSLGYVSDNPRVDDKFRQVSVRVVSGSSGKSVQARTRQGYFATAEHQPGLQVPRVGPQGESAPGSSPAPRAMPVKFEMPAGPPSGTVPATGKGTRPGTVSIPKWSTHEIRLFDAGDAVTTGEARTYRYIEYMTARYGAFARVVWGLRPAAPADDTQAFWRAARSLLTSADPYFLDGEHVRVSREVCSAAPRSTSSQMAVD